jgi:CDGSH-type Zn-finger protein
MITAEQNKPFCAGAHKEIGFAAEQAADVAAVELVL